MEKTMEGTLTIPSHGLLTPPPPLHAMPRSKTGRKPQRSSPLAGPAVSVDDSDDTPSRLRISSSPSLDRDFNNSLLLPTPRQNLSSGLTRPKSMYSTLSLHPQSLTPQDRSYESLPGTKQLRRPVSAVLPLTATQVHFSDRHSSIPKTAGDFQKLGEQNYGPLTRPTIKHHASPSTTRPLTPPTILLNDFPQFPIPPPVSPTATTIPKDNSWYITNTYEETPRFSRLAAASVVMPVSAKEYNRCSGTRGLCDSTRLNSSDSLNTGNRRSLLIGSLASSLRLTRSNPNLASSDHQSQEPFPSSPSSPSSKTFPGPDSDSSPATSATSTFSPASSLYRTRSNSFTDSSSSSSSSSSYTFSMPDIVTSSSRTSINEEVMIIQDSSSSTIVHGKDVQQVERIPSIAEKDRSKNVLVSEKSRRGGTFRKFIKLFVST